MGCWEGMERLGGRENRGNVLALKTAINGEVAAIGGDDAMAWKQFAHANQAQIGKVRLSICKLACQGGQFRKMLAGVEGQTDESLFHHLKNRRGIAEVERRFRKHRFTRQQRFRNLTAEAFCPCVVFVTSIFESDEETGIGNSSHVRE